MVETTVGLAPVIDDLYDPNSPGMADIPDPSQHQPLPPPTESLQQPSASTRPSLQIQTQDYTQPSRLLMGKIAYGGGEYYPTLQRTLHILSRLYGCVPPAVFEGISAEVIDLCRNSLVTVADMLASKQTKLDGQLFLIKNLLMLREQVIPFDTEFIIKEESLDFANMIDGLMMAIRTSWTVNALSNIANFSSILAASAPRVVQSYADSKQLLDRDLKRVCEDLILETARAALDPLSSFLLKVSAFRLRHANRDGTARELLRNQNFATPGESLTPLKT